MSDLATKVRTIVADALYLELDETTLDSNLMNDLGAESIDFLDIVFKLEKEFSVKIPRGDVERRAQGNLSTEDFASAGKITDLGLEQLRRAMPEADPKRIKAGLMVRDIASLFTVQTFVRMVAEQLGEIAIKASNAAEQPLRTGTDPVRFS